MFTNADFALKDLTQSTRALIQGETDDIANMANISAIIALCLDRINWCGFYIVKGEELVLGPFQGKPACIRIAFGKGVCGTAAQTGQTLVADDVTRFPGHIACDPDSRSEIVTPIFRDGRVFAVLDVDSADTGRFGAEERAALEEVARILA